MTRIGPAGWSYQDWQGVVYPATPGLDHLRYLSGLFTTIEINNTFYHTVAPRIAESWVSRTQQNPDFRFTVKLWRNFTHQREKLNPGEVKKWKEGIRPLQEAEQLGTVLVQFPWSFKNSHESCQQLIKRIKAFSQFPLVVEFRHSSWYEEEVRNLLCRAGVGICNIDQPLIGKSIRPQSDVTSPISYFRCHGRNYRNWFREGAGRNARYNYLYNGQELNEQVDLIQDLQRKARDVYVIYNNHFRGQAAVNALQVRKQLEGRLQEIPEQLLRTYPELRGFETNAKDKH